MRRNSEKEISNFDQHDDSEPVQYDTFQQNGTR